MNIKDKIEIYLDQIKQVKGIENVVLSQRDGNPIQSSGMWFSKNDIFDICTASCAIYNLGIKISPKNLNLNSILIEGNNCKILIAPLDYPIQSKQLATSNASNSDQEFFITITAQQNVNLGGMLLQTREALKNVKTALIASGESFKPPLIQFSDKKIQEIIEGFNVKENENCNFKVETYSLALPNYISKEIDCVLKEFSKNVPSLRFTAIIADGGFVISKLIKDNFKDLYDLDSISAMSYSMLKTSNRIAYLLKRSNLNSVLIENQQNYQFICSLGKAILTTEITKNQKLGLLRLIIPKFIEKIDSLIKKASDFKQPEFDFKQLMGNIKIV